MIKKVLFAGVAALLAGTPAYAGHCPADAAAIDHALGVLSVSDDIKAEVQSMRDKGMEEHEAGNHAEAEGTMSEAMRTLLMAAE